MSHILIIDDEKFFRDIVVQMLQQDGHKTTEADDGGKAMVLLQHTHPDLIITDILMPHMDCVEFIMELAKQSKNIPLIAMSGGRHSISSSFNLESAKLLEARVTLAKPFNQAKLRAAIQEALA